MTNLKQKSIDAIAWNLIEKYGNQIVSLVLGVILARLLSPSDYGLIGMISVFFVLAKVFINGGFGAAYIQNKDSDEIDASTIFFFNIFASIVVFLILWLVAPLIANFYNQEVLIKLIRVSGIVIVIQAFGMMQISKLTKDVKFKKKSLISLFSTLISGVFGVIAALNNYQVWSLVIQQITSAFIFSLGLWIFYEWRPIWIFSKDSFRKMFTFSSWMLLSNILNTFFNNIYVFYIGKFYPAAQLGFYTKAKGYSNMATKNMFSSISIVSFPIFSKYQNDKILLKNSLKKFLSYIMFYLAPIVAILIISAKPLIFIVLTEKWLPMVPFFQLLLFIGLLDPIRIMNNQLLNAMGKSKLSFKISLVRNFMRLINIILLSKYGILYLLLGELIITLIMIFIIGIITKKMINYSAFEQVKDISMTLLIFAIILVMGYFLSNNVTNVILQIIIGVVAPMLLYTLFYFIFNKQFLIENINLIKDKFIKR